MLKCRLELTCTGLGRHDAPDNKPPREQAHERERERWRRADVHHRLHCLNEPYRSEAVHRDKVHFAVSYPVAAIPRSFVSPAPSPPSIPPTLPLIPFDP